MDKIASTTGERKQIIFIYSDEGLSLETSALKIFMAGDLRYQLSWYTKLPCYALPPTQHHSFFKKLLPLFS